MLPNLSDLGFTGQPQSQPLITGDAGSAVELYQRPSPAASARVDIALYKGTDTAKTSYTTVSTQMASLPPNLFGATTTQQKTGSTGIGDQSTAYVTGTPDASGERVWTDVYRFGDVVSVTFVIDKDESQALVVRKAIAGQLEKNAAK